MTFFNTGHHAFSYFWSHNFWRTSIHYYLAFVCLINIVHCQRPNPVTRNFECRASCCDQHEWCRFWASIGECQRNKDWMDPNCMIACDMCSSTDAGSGSGPPPSRSGGGRSQGPGSQGPGASFRSDGNRLSRCEEIVRQSPSQVAQLANNERLVNTREDNSFRRTLSLSDINRSNGNIGCVPSLDFTDCKPNMCYHMMYRSMDGTCNNLASPLHGAAFTPLLRVKEPIYDNNIAVPTSAVSGDRPSAREASRFLLSSNQQVTNNAFSAMLMQWGQFMAHDISKTTQLPSEQCRSCENVPGRCFNIRTMPTDQRFGQFGCLRMARSTPVCGTGRNTPQQQLNENTAFLDGSMIYGSSAADLAKFRDGLSGRLRTTFFANKIFMPFNQNQCLGPQQCKATFKAGDNRANIFIGLAAMHTLFLREHNGIAEGLRAVNPGWSGDRIFHEARKIVGAQIQKITYKDWMPKILGSQLNNVLGTYNGYNPSVNPSIANHFTTAAFRFGHGMIQEFYNRLDDRGRPIPQGGVRFDDAVFKSQKLLFEGGVDPILRGMMTTGAKRPQRLTPAVTERLFGTTDLASTNIQRGRDHGIPGYNEWRNFCRLKKAVSFDDLRSEILDENVRRNLEQGYSNPDKVDLYVGSMLEDPVIDGMIGPTLTCLLGDQFKRLRDGDRLWYENPGTFTLAQLAEIENVTLSRILCNNGDMFRFAPVDSFHLTTGQNLVPCDNIPKINLEKWRQT